MHIRQWIKAVVGRSQTDPHCVIRRKARRWGWPTEVATSVQAFEIRTLLSAVAWDGGGGDFNWNTAANWTTDALPGAADDVTIDIAGANTITLASGTVSIRSLQSNEALTLSGGTPSNGRAVDSDAEDFG